MKLRFFSLLVSAMVGCAGQVSYAMDSDATREQNMQKTAQGIHQNIKLAGQDLTFNILVSFFKACKEKKDCKNKNIFNIIEKRVFEYKPIARASLKKEHYAENYAVYKEGYKPEHGIRVESDFSAENTVKDGLLEDTNVLDKRMLGDLQWDLRHVNMGTIRDRFTMCQFFRYYDADLTFKTLYSCSTHIGPMDDRTKEWVERAERKATENQ